MTENSASSIGRIQCGGGERADTGRRLFSRVYRKPTRVPRPGRGCLLNPALLHPTWHGATAPRRRGLVSGTQGTRLRVCPAAGGRLGAIVPDQLFGEVHRDTFADGMAVFCNANGRRDDGRMEGRAEGVCADTGLGLIQEQRSSEQKQQQKPKPAASHCHCRVQPRSLRNSRWLTTTPPHHHQQGAA
ncbi:uncharacterized protein AAES06_010685 [Glossophaga mutica]